MLLRLYQCNHGRTTGGGGGGDGGGGNGVMVVVAAAVAAMGAANSKSQRTKTALRGNASVGIIAPRASVIAIPTAIQITRPTTLAGLPYQPSTRRHTRGRILPFQPSTTSQPPSNKATNTHVRYPKHVPRHGGTAGCIAVHLYVYTKYTRVGVLVYSSIRTRLARVRSHILPSVVHSLGKAARNIKQRSHREAKKNSNLLAGEEAVELVLVAFQSDRRALIDVLFLRSDGRAHCNTRRHVIIAHSRMHSLIRLRLRLLIVLISSWN